MAFPLAARAQNQINMTINQEAPVVQSKEVSINAKPEKVWQVLTDIENWSDWNEKIKKPSVKEEPNVGVSFTWKINGSNIKSQIHTYDPNKAFGWTGKTFGAKAIHNWYLEPTAHGTKVIVKESMEGWLIALLKKKMNTVLADDLGFWLEQLKVACEK
jgi:uncharacterized protein YndB with AHSA1/START domain